MMKKEITFTVVELCQRVEISEDELVEIVGLGVIVPLEPAQPRWEFDYPALSHLQPKPTISGTKDLPGSPSACIRRSITNAARAM